MNKDYFSERKTIRRYSGRDIDPALISSIVDRAVHAPTTGNMQLYSVVATVSPDALEALAPLHFNQPAATSAKAILTICADLGRFSRWCSLSGAKPGFGNLQGLMYGIFDAVILGQQIVTVAENEGLGTCYLGTTTFNAPQIAEQLNLPDMVVPLLSITLGYPDENGEATERIGSDGVLYFNRYPDLSDSDIREIYKVKDEYPANAGYAAEHGKQNIAQVFTDVRYPEGMNREFSAPFLEFIRKSGFDI